MRYLRIIFFFLLLSSSMVDAQNNNHFLSSGIGYMQDIFFSPNDAYNSSRTEYSKGSSIYIRYAYLNKNNFLLLLDIELGSMHYAVNMPNTIFDKQLFSESYYLGKIGIGKILKMKKINSNIIFSGGIVYIGSSFSYLYNNLSTLIKQSNKVYYYDKFAYANSPEIGAFMGINWAYKLSSNLFLGLKLEGTTSFFIGPMSLSLSPNVMFKF